MEQHQDIFSRQLRRCVAQPGFTTGIVKPGGRMSMWERSLQPSGKLSRHGRLVKAQEHHTMQPNALPDVQCTMLAKKQTRSTRILTVPYFFGFKTVFSFQNKPKYLDPSYKMVLDLWVCLGRVKMVL